jgi:hypothetical protein
MTWHYIGRLKSITGMYPGCNTILDRRSHCRNLQFALLMHAHTLTDEFADSTIAATGQLLGNILVEVLTQGDAGCIRPLSWLLKYLAIV